MINWSKMPTMTFAFYSIGSFYWLTSSSSLGLISLSPIYSMHDYPSTRIISQTDPPDQNIGARIGQPVQIKETATIIVALVI